MLMPLLPVNDTAPNWITLIDDGAVMFTGVTVMATLALAIRLVFVSRSSRLSVSAPVYPGFGE